MTVISFIAPLAILAFGGMGSTILLAYFTRDMVYGVFYKRYEYLVNWIFTYFLRLVFFYSNLIYYSNYLQFSFLSEVKTSLPKFTLECILLYGCEYLLLILVYSEIFKKVLYLVLMIYNWSTIIQLQVQLRYDAMVQRNLNRQVNKTVMI